MATLLLSAAGAAAGSAVGGSVLGLSAAAIGRAVGASLGQVLDQRLMGTGSEVIERGQIDRFRLTGASEGAAVPRLFGRMRIPGQVIWASDFLESQSSNTARGGKGGGGPSVTTTSYSYSVSLAVALCEGEVSHLGRIWADGQEISERNISYTLYPGSESQLPDPKIAAIEGAAQAPAYRGTAYVVFEDMPLAEFGNRVPQFSFEVIRPEQQGAMDAARSMVDGVQAVAMIPGTGEYALATTPVHYAEGPGRNRSANVHTPSGQSDFTVSMRSLNAEVPNCEAVSLVVCWFGDDLRCDRTKLRPKVEHKNADGVPLQWNVSGLNRVAALEVPRLDGRSVYGGTPTDASVVEAIRDINRRGQSVMFYPFILMEQLPGNVLTDPYTGATGQAPLPWRGRITTSRGPGQPGSPDGTSAAAAEVAAFFGAARPGDFQVSGDRVIYTGPDEWSMRRFILHYAALCKAAGGVEAFCIGTEMVALTQIRGAGNSFPAVEAFRQLAADVRAILGAGVKLTYAADWSEYFGYSPQDGSGDRFFHLDPLWADPNIDFIGIDNYMPLSDWRDGEEHEDAAWGSIYDLGYLKANVAGGEGYDWYYADEQSAAAQLRTAITDGAHDEPWVYRYKDIEGWWSNPHHERVGGVRSAAATAWVPRSKPVWFTEYGCAAIDKGTNQPNKFLDPKSSESLLPRASNGARDDLIQMQYLRAMGDYWRDGANNPVSPIYGGPMIDMSRAFVWAWDARPYPWFPGLGDVWDDGANYVRGHWLNGRTGSQLLSTVVREVCQKAGIAAPDLSRLHGLVRGFAVTQAGPARAALEPLMLAHGFDAHESGGALVFRNRSAVVDANIDGDGLARHPDSDIDLQRTRAAEAETSARVRLGYVAADGAYEVKMVETALPGAEGDHVSQSEVNMVLSAAEARAITERWLAEGRIARDSARLALPPSRLDLTPGDVVALTLDGTEQRYRIDRSEQLGLQVLEAVRVEPGVYLPGPPVEEIVRVRAARAPMPPTAVFLDLPMLSSETVPHAPYLAIAARPWPGTVAVFSSGSDADYQLNTLVDGPTVLGITRSPLPRAAHGLVDNGPPLEVELSDGELASVPFDDLLNGANAMAIGDGAAREWEVFQFERADLIGQSTYALSKRLRGQLGTDAAMPDVWPAGSLVVALGPSLKQITLSSGQRGLRRHYRIGPAALPYTDGSFVHRPEVFEGVGLRPYAPVHLRARRDAAGTDNVTWVRRTRVDGDLWSLTDVPVGEASELYVVRVVSGGAPRRESIVAQPAWAYPAAQRAADGVTGAYDVEIAQISDRFGPGPFGKVRIG